MSYTLSKYYYITDNLLSKTLNLFIAISVLFCIKEIIATPTIKNILVAISLTLVMIGLLRYLANYHKEGVSNYQKYQLGDDEYPSVHIAYTEGLVELNHSRKYSIIPIEEIEKVYTINLLFTVLVYIRTVHPEDSMHFLINRKLAIPFRKRLRDEVQHSRRTHRTKDKTYEAPKHRKRRIG